MGRDHVSREHSAAAVGFHFGGRPHKRKHCLVLTSLVLGGLHQRSGVALPTGGRTDPAVGNEALAGTRRSAFFSLVPGARWYPTLKPRKYFSTLRPRLVEQAHTHTRTNFLGGMYQASTRNSLRSNNIYMLAEASFFFGIKCADGFESRQLGRGPDVA